LSHILVLNGPNLNLLGTREPDVYGSETLEDVQALCDTTGEQYGLEVTFRQSNLEGELVGWIQEAPGRYSGIILNAGALTHTSIALLDALLAVGIPTIEVHLSNIYRREEFRQTSYISRAAQGVICGLGSQGYGLALQALAALPEISATK
jgi:3-dehydroquinate dehydratase II